MGPRAELSLAAVLSGAAVTVLGHLAASALVLDGELHAGSLRTALVWSPSGALAAAGAAWLLAAWHRRAVMAGRRWLPAGMAARATVLALALYPLAVALWLPASAGIDRWLDATPAMSWRELWRWLPSVVLGATLAALIAGSVPAYASALPICRRYMRRQACSTTDPA